MSEFCFIQSLKRAMVMMDKYGTDEPSYYELNIALKYSIIVRRLNKNSTIQWIEIDYMLNEKDKDEFIKGYKEIKL